MTKPLLSDLPDGMGFYYGFYRGSRVDVRLEDGHWAIYVEGDYVEHTDDWTEAQTKAKAFIDAMEEREEATVGEGA